MKSKLKEIGISVVCILAIIAGFSYAFFSPQEVSGNKYDNRIKTTIAKYGILEVTYFDSDDGIILLDATDLPYSNQTNISSILKLSVVTSNEQNVDTYFNIKWGGSSQVANTICQYANNSVCTNNSSHTYVGDEVTYQVYECSTETAYNNATVENLSECNQIVAPTAAPYTEQEKSSVIVANQMTGPSDRDHYYIIKLTIENKNTPQDYQGGKSFSGAVIIDSLQD